MLSSYPAEKVVVTCTKCGLRKRYDKAAMLAAGGDRPLTILLEEIAKRGGCTKLGERVDIYDRCAAIYEGLVDLLKAEGRL